MKLTVLLLAAVSAFAQAEPAPAFLTADVHVYTSTANPTLFGLIPGTNRFDLRGATMVDLVRLAWGVDASRVAGGPSWLATDRFDVIATAPGRPTRDEANLMLRALLADRFKLVVHDGTRPLPAFAMTVAKGGAKMKKSNGPGESGCVQRQEEPASTTYVCHAMTMPAFAESLPHLSLIDFLGNPLVVDQTHLDGAWDFTFRFTARGAAPAGEGTPLFEATEKQLGLHIESARVPLPVIVVESVNEKPADNAPGATETPQTAAVEFDVALLKPSAPGATQVRISLQGGKVDLQNIPLRALITLAWNLTADKIIGLPDFVDTDRYDLKAQPPAGADAGIESLRTMLRALLTQRFGMKLHNEDRAIDVYALVASKPKLKKADPGNRSDCQNVANASTIVMRSIACQNTTTEQFAAALKRMAGGYFSQRAVVDATGIDGAWDMTLNFSPAGAVQNAAASDPDGSISIFDALEKQLGLKLETQKRAMPVMVIDHIEKKPGDN